MSTDEKQQTNNDPSEMAGDLPDEVRVNVNKAEDNDDDDFHFEEILDLGDTAEDAAVDAPEGVADTANPSLQDLLETRKRSTKNE